MKVALFFLPPSLGGGSTSFTVHLYKGFRLAGIESTIYRVKPKGEHCFRPFAKYKDVQYKNITLDEALKIVKRTPSLLTAPAHSKHLKHAPDAIARLMKAGMRIVIHDPNEFKVFDHLGDRESSTRLPRQPFCIRPTMQNFYPRAVYIPHPYVRYFNSTDDGETFGEARAKNAASVARISFVKRTEMILDANRLLPKDKKCVLLGAENRLYTRFKILPEYPEFKQGGFGFPMEWGAAPSLLSNYKYAVDLTWFPDDGGGSQYSFMEAWDAGAINVVHCDWLRYKGEMVDGLNCIAIKGPKSLARVLESDEPYDDIVYRGIVALKKHDPVMVANRYMEELNR